MALVGLDVHQAQTVAAVLDPVSGELHVQRLRGAPSEVVPVFMQRLAGPVRAVYEAGPTGVGLARAAAARGLDLRVGAPGAVPRAPGGRGKTDRRDAKRVGRRVGRRGIGSRRIDVTPSGWSGCSRPASCRLRSCPAKRTSASAISCAASTTRART